MATDDFTVVPLFSTPLYLSDLKNQNFDDILTYLKGLRFDRMNQGNGAISENMSILEAPELENLNTEVKRHIRKYIDNTLFLSGEWYVHTSWSILHEPGDYATEHIHPNSLFSGVMYFQVEEDCGSIFFKHPHDNLLPHTIRPALCRHNIYNVDEYTLTPPQGAILMFPSNVPHFVSENNSGENRYVIAFNVFVRGEFGNPTSNLTLL